MKDLWERFTALDMVVQVTVVVVVGALLAIGLFFGANYMPVVDGLLGAK